MADTTENNVAAAVAEEAPKQEAPVVEQQPAATPAEDAKADAPVAEAIAEKPAEVEAEKPAAGATRAVRCELLSV